MTRRRFALISCLLAGVALCAWLASRGDESAEQHEHVGRAAAPGAAPTLLGTVRTSVSSERVAQERDGAASHGVIAKPSPYFFPGARMQDDPALPPERGWLEVEVVDARGQPVPRARVVGRWGEWYTREFMTDGHGRVRMAVPPHTHGLEVVGQAGESTGRFCLVHYHPLSAEGSSTCVVLRSYRTISGSVRTDDGVVPKGRVRAYRLHVLGEPRLPTAGLYLRAQGAGRCPVGPDGSFALEVPDDQPVTLVCGAAARGRWVHAIERDVVAGTADVRLVAGPMRTSASLHLNLMCSRGRPAEGARVRCHPVAEGDAPARAGLEGVTDEAGHVTFEPLAPWVYRVEIDAPSEPDATWRAYSTLVRPGRNAVDVQLPPPSAPLEGRVMDAGGVPVQGAWVCVLRRGTYLACMGSDAEGRFRGSSNVPAGTMLQVVARYPMNDPTARAYAYDVEAGGRPCTLTLQELGPLTAARAGEQAAQPK